MDYRYLIGMDVLHCDVDSGTLVPVQSQLVRCVHHDKITDFTDRELGAGVDLDWFASHQMELFVVLT